MSVNESKKFIVVDGNSILNRAYYGVRALSTRSGFPTNAIFGTVNILSKHLTSLSPDYAAVAFDMKSPTFRHKMYSDYKAGRKPMPEDLALQLPEIKKVLAAMGFNVVECEGYEADDILGTLARVAEESSDDCTAYLVTGDRDALQLISPKVHILLEGNNGAVDYDEKAFLEKYLVRSSQFVDMKAIMGDSSDNIPGVPGIGEKGAQKLLINFGSLDNIYKDLDSLEGLTKGERQKLEAGKDSAFMSRTLAAICKTAPINCDLSAYEYHGFKEGELYDLFAGFEFTKLIDKFGLSSKSQTNDNGKALQSIIDPEVIVTDAPTLTDRMSVCVSDGKMYLCDGTKVFVSDLDVNSLICISNKTSLICHDSKKLYEINENIGVSFDTMLGAYVLDSGNNDFSLSRIIPEYLGYEVSDDTAKNCFLIYRLSEAIIKALDETAQRSVFENIEMPLSKVLFSMEKVGILLDTKAIYDFGIELDSDIEAIRDRVFMEAGHEFNLNSPKQLGEVLFEELKLPSKGKTKGKTGYSTSADILESLKKVHPIVGDILEYRQLAKLKSTYVDGLLKVADENGRIHTTFKQTGTATGRLSSAEPNLQNIPIRTDLGRKIRSFFIPSDNDKILIDADYSQIELRILAHISKDENMTAAFLSGEDIHTSTAARVFGLDPKDVTKEHRKRAKAINFGILYGMGEYSLSEDLNISIAKAKDYISGYLSSYPQISDYLCAVVETAKKFGYVTTMYERRRYIPEINAQNKNLVHFGERVAMNSPIQGSAADIMKIAMINTYNRLKEENIKARILIQVHDELLIEADKSDADRAREVLICEMENAAKLSVPLKVEAESGNNWLECH